MTLIRLLAIRTIRRRVRPIAIRLLRQELAERENAARTLAAGAYLEGKGPGGLRPSREESRRSVPTYHETDPLGWRAIEN